MYYVYMMRCSDNSLYIGITTDLMRRFKEHKEKDGKGAKYTRARSVTRIAAAWQTQDGRAEASRLEYRLKKLDKKRKEILCENPDRLCEFYENGQGFSAVSLSNIPAALP